MNMLNVGKLKTVNTPVQQNETLKAINSPCLFIKMHKMYKFCLQLPCCDCLPCIHVAAAAMRRYFLSAGFGEAWRDTHRSSVQDPVLLTVRSERHFESLIKGICHRFPAGESLAKKTQEINNKMILFIHNIIVLLHNYYQIPIIFFF